MRLLVGVISITMFLNSCDFINPAEELPGYIKIDKIHLLYEPNALKITDAWVYMNGNLQGVYELPAQFPILEKGTHEFKIYAGIKVNGIAKTRTWYPFYFPFEVEQNIEDLEVIELEPVVGYNENVTIKWEETFENIGMSLDTVPGNSKDIVFYNDDIYDGNYSGAILLEKDDTYFECITQNAFDLPRTREPVFMELNYKNDIVFNIGMYINTGGVISVRPMININESEEWNKIYIDLANALNEYQDATSFKYYFLISKQDTTRSAKVLLDNIKIVL